MVPENDNENEEVETPKEDEVIEDVKEDLKEGDLSMHDLEALEQKLTAHIKSIQRDSTKDAEEKAALEGKIDRLQEHIERLIQAQEEKDRKHDDESTIIVPPKELNPPTHMNKEEVTPENEQPTKGKKRRMGWY